MLTRIAAVLAGLAALMLAWWIADRNGEAPNGEVTFVLVVSAPLSDAVSSDTVLIPGGGDTPSDTVKIKRRAMEASGTSLVPDCSGLPTLDAAHPELHWVLASNSEGLPFCWISARWSLAELLENSGGDLVLQQESGQLRLSYRPPSRSTDFSTDVRSFEFAIRFPSAAVSAGDGAVVDGSTVRWSGTNQLRDDVPLEASGAVLTPAQALAPWALAGLGVLLIGIAVGWPRSRAGSDAAGDETGGRETSPAASPSDRHPRVRAAVAVPRGVARGPDPNSPWRPPSSSSPDAFDSGGRDR